jgi:lysophospholipase L1-like esterase
MFGGMNAGARSKRRTAPLLTAAIVFAAIGIAACQRAGDTVWVAAWGASPLAYVSFSNTPPPAAYEDQTVRQLVRISAGGDQLRVRFSNEIGNEPLLIGSASLAIVDNESSIRPESLRNLTFGGETSITVPAGAPALSDPVDLPVTALTELAVSIYLPQETPPGTVHMGRNSRRSSAGNFTSAIDLPGAEKTMTMVFLSGIYVRTAEETGVIVAIGDSITDGAASTPFTYNSWPDHLAQRLFERDGNNRAMAVINQGISGNQLLRTGAGISVLGRLDRDVLATPGLTHIVMLIGINDIGAGGLLFPGATGPPPAMRTASEIIAGYRQVIARAHSMSPPVKIYGATLTPFAGTAFPGYYSPQKDEVRKAVNEWIRTSGEFDAVIDFDLAIRDPDHPLRMATEYDSGDKLHPGDAGYKKMAESIDLTLFE